MDIVEKYFYPSGDDAPESKATLPIGTKIVLDDGRRGVITGRGLWDHYTISVDGKEFLMNWKYVYEEYEEKGEKIVQNEGNDQ